MDLSFDVYGLPTPKGSTTRMPNGAHVPAGTPASRERMAKWRDDIRACAIREMEGAPLMRGGIRLLVEFRLPVPATMPKRDFGWLPHSKRPDVDKLFRALGDAMTGTVWVDDSQVCYSTINKVYAWDGRTGASIWVGEVSEHAAREFANHVEAFRHLRGALES